MERILVGRTFACIDVVDDRPVDLVEAGFDAGIRFGETVERDMVTVRVGPDLRTVVVGMADHLSNHPHIETPNDLEAHNCVNYRLLGGAGLLPWEFVHGGRDVRVRARGQLIVNDGSLAGAAVRAGASLGYMLEDDAASDLAPGRLVQVLRDCCPPFPGCHLFYPVARSRPRSAP